MIQEKYVYNNEWIKKNIDHKKKNNDNSCREEGWRTVEGVEELGEDVVNPYCVQSSLVVQQGIMISNNTG